MNKDAQRVAIVDYMAERVSSGLAMDISFALLDPQKELWAMHEAEKVLTSATERQAYAERLMDVTRGHCIGIVPDWNSDRLSLIVVATATAAQRCEAFLRTLNLWTD